MEKQNLDSSVPPLLETRSLVLGGGRRLEAASLAAHGPKLALWDECGHLLRALIEPQQIQSGSLLLLGKEPAFWLSSGEVAYIPTSLPLPGNVKVLEALTLSARLLGLSKSDARLALSRCRLGALESKKLGDLTRLQSRLSCIAHGVLGEPRVFLLENVFAGLDEPETAIVEAVLAALLDQKSYVIACSSADPGSRTMALGCDEALRAAGDQILPPSPPKLETAAGYWVSCLGDVTPLTELLKSRGAEVARSPRASVFFVRSLAGAAIYRAAHEMGVPVLELTPSGVGGD